MEPAERALSDYADGKTAALHKVELRISAAGLVVRGPHVSAFWPAEGLEILDATASETSLRLGHAEYSGARLTITDDELKQQITGSFPQLLKKRRDGRRTDMKRVAWAGGITVALAAAFFLLLPSITSTLAALVPYSMEKRLGDSAFSSFSKVFEGAGESCNAPEGKAALDRMVVRLTRDMELSGPVDVHVVPVDMVNAVAFPGGRILIFEGLLLGAESPEEVAGVVAHEIGHAHHRHGIEGLIRNSAIDAVISIFAPGGAGDVSAGLGSALLSQSYSRDAEREADGFAVTHLNRLNVEAEGMARFFERLSEKGRNRRVPKALQLLSSHPASVERFTTIRRDGTGQGRIMSTEDWLALQEICDERA